MKKEIITCDCCGVEMPNHPDAYRGEFKANLPKYFRGETTVVKYILSDICMGCATKILSFSETLKDGNQSHQADVSGSLPDELLLAAIKYGYDYHSTTSFPNEAFEVNMLGNALQWIENQKQ